MRRKEDKEKVCVIGLGYVGLPTAAILASRGYPVLGVEPKEGARRIIASGKAHIVEPELDMLVEAGVQTERLRVSAAIKESDVFILCVPTPLGEDAKPDLSYVMAATENVATVLKEGDLVILESTSPPRTTELVADTLCRLTGFKPGSFYCAHAPERVLPGKVVQEVVANARVVGGVDEASTERCARFYSGWVTGEILKTNSRAAETIKLVENSYRDVNIAFANELSMAADELDLDVREIIELANFHPRVNILSPGPGVGGHCIAIDPYFLIDAAPNTTPLIAQARRVNQRKVDWVIEKVRERAGDGDIVCLLGLAYKPDSDDLRESPAVAIARKLREEFKVNIVEPYLMTHPEFELTELDEALKNSELIVSLVAHRQFGDLSPDQLSEKKLLDIVGIFPEVEA